ncbi:MAG: MFS transporter [Dermatophilaceae bacterium]
MADPAAPVGTGTWAPLSIAAFRTLWVALLVSNIGTLMQTMGAKWWRLVAVRTS